LIKDQGAFITAQGSHGVKGPGTVDCDATEQKKARAGINPLARG
jgi:hypothetical protein